MKKKPLSPTNVSELSPAYFELQAYWGATKHMGGLRTTRELIKLCQINQDTYVLDVGCGVGATPAYLAKRYGCRVFGVDISERMIERAEEKIKREHVEDRVELRVADAQNLPFDASFFDVVMTESVLTFVQDKQKAVSECARVIRPGGYVGLNEEVWVKTPSPEVVAYATRAWDIHAEILTRDSWEAVMKSAGLQEIIARTYRFNASPGEYLDELRRYTFKEYLGMCYRAMTLYAKNPAFREYIKGRYSSLPKNFFEQLGFGIFVGNRICHSSDDGWGTFWYPDNEGAFHTSRQQESICA